MSRCQNTYKNDILYIKKTTMNPEYEQTIHSFVETHSPKICILTPCYNGSCFTSYVSSLMNTVTLLQHFKIAYQIEFCNNDSLVSRARNNLLAKAMMDPKMTHVLFIDADITWNPPDVLKLLLANKLVVGGIYPLKQYNWSKMAQDPSTIQQWVSQQKDNNVFKNYPTEQYIQHKLLNYNVTHQSNTLTIENNLCEVKHIACGFMMIKRNTIELMQQAFPSTKYIDDVAFLTPEQSQQAYALFECGVEEGRYLSEDWMFCNRWKNMGGKIYSDITINLTHTGTQHFSGSYLTSLLGETAPDS
jgi:hypothetical protein